MYLFLLTRERAMYDEARGFVICAESEEAARQIAHEHGSDEACEDVSEWHTSAKCQIIGEPLGVSRGVILRDFVAG